MKVQKKAKVPEHIREKAENATLTDLHPLVGFKDVLVLRLSYHYRLVYYVKKEKTIVCSHSEYDHLIQAKHIR